ncbi:hypothetical protein CDAR_51541 [Caerostris darwini]|uniref:Uncharacterized protein n=1 Tax=Caerostris darwini TaxID=1538125 RepID=A0AAV4V7H5_9ARAC|nr:hypothetical protein CDAR_51541 [Caerostris darwini]
MTDTFTKDVKHIQPKRKAHMIKNLVGQGGEKKSFGIQTRNQIFPGTATAFGPRKFFLELLREILRVILARKTAAKKNSGRSSEKEDLKFK